MKRPFIVKTFRYSIILASLLLTYMYLESRWLKTTEHTIHSSDLKQLSSELKVVFISDIHHGTFFSKKRLRKLVKRINNLQPDIILMGGDYVQRNPKYIPGFYAEMRSLEAPYGVYAILGNHDHWEGKEKSLEHMKKAGIINCDNRSFWIDCGEERIKIRGVGDLWEDEQNLHATTGDLLKEDYCILLSHNPDYFENFDDDRVDLGLAGHTHGGQVTLFGKYAPVLPTKTGNMFRYGFTRNNDTLFYVTSGVGTVTPPLRFFCRPEIVMFHLSDK